MNRRDFLITTVAATTALALPTTISASTATATVRPIQQQGSSPFCLFATNAYICNADMWHVAAEYYRRNLPTFPNTILPYNENILALCSDLYGVAFHVADQWQWQQARDALNAGHQVVATGNGHALVLLSWGANGWITYLDSLHDGVQKMTVRDFWDWQDGWYWWRSS